MLCGFYRNLRVFLNNDYLWRIFMVYIPYKIINVARGPPDLGFSRSL